MTRKEILSRLYASFKQQAIPRLHLYHATETDVMRDSERRFVRTSTEAYDLFKPFFQPSMQHREVFYLMLLNRRNGVIGVVEIASGGVNGVVVDTKIVFGAALVAQASAILVAHNHPSGQMRPSQEDIHLTKNMVDAGRALDTELRDHIIVCEQGYYSFADNGQL